MDDRPSEVDIGIEKRKGRPSKTNKLKVSFVRMDQSECDYLQGLADKTGTTKSHYLREAVRAYVAAHKKLAALFEKKSIGPEPMTPLDINQEYENGLLSELAKSKLGL